MKKVLNTLVLLMAFGLSSFAQICDTPSGLAAAIQNNAEVLLTWDAVAGATAYRVRVELESGTIPFEIRTTTTTNQYLATGLDSSGIYKFKVRTLCGQDQSDWSEDVFFTISGNPGGGGPGPVLCAAPTGLAATNITDSSAVLSWDPVPGVTQYRVEIEDADNTTPFNLELTVTGNSYTVMGLAAGGNYKFKVKSRCSSNNFSDYSEWFFFSGNGNGGPGGGDCTVPVNLMVSNITSTTALISWDAVPAAVEGYELEVEAEGITMFFLNVIVPGTSYLVDGLTANEPYKVKVKAKCGNVSSDYTDWVFFSTSNNGGGPGGGVCTTPTNLTVTNITATTAVVSWDPVAAALEGYELQVESEENTPFFELELLTQQTSVLVEGLSPNGLYKAKVKAECGSNSSDHTDWVFFTTPGMLIAPNPMPRGGAASLALTTAEGEMLIQIMDLQGNIQWNYSGPAAESLELPLQQLRPGVYNVVLAQGKSLINQRLVIAE